MATSCAGDIASVAQLGGIDAIRLVGMIANAASNARIHKRNCQEFAQYVKMIGDLLRQLNISELMAYRETRAPLEGLEDALRRSYIVVNSCQNRSFPYVLAMGWNIADKFRRAEAEIERYLKLIPLITLVDLQRLRGGTEGIESDLPEYVVDEAEENMQEDASSNPGRPKKNLWRRLKMSWLRIPRVEGKVPEFLRNFKLNELRSATQGFADENIISGRREYCGQSTLVYKGWFHNIGFVAIKKWELGSTQASQEWQTEMNVLGNMSHPNLISLLGYCNEDNVFLLVYEFMANGCLEDHLLGKTEREPLSWERRMKIAIGAAKCLEFLHTSEKHIIHQGVKPSVILLDSTFNAKLSGLRCSKNGPSDEDLYVSAQVMGTHEYLDPQYESGYLDAKTDVYAFGIVLLQMLTGQKVYDPNRSPAKRHLIQFAKPHLSDPKQLGGQMDPKLNGQYPSKAALQLAQLSLSCTNYDGDVRPDMEEVVKTLEQIETMEEENGGVETRL